MACEVGSLEIIKKLIKKGVDINALDHNKWTALHYSCKNGFHTITEYLLSKGADCTITNERGKKIIF